MEEELSSRPRIGKRKTILDEEDEEGEAQTTSRGVKRAKPESDGKEPSPDKRKILKIDDEAGSQKVTRQSQTSTKGGQPTQKLSQASNKKAIEKQASPSKNKDDAVQMEIDEIDALDLMNAMS